MASTSFLCSSKALLLLLVLFTAVPLSILVSLDSRASRGAYSYRSGGWMRESAKWDHLHRRFLVSFMEGGIGQIPLPGDALALGGPTLHETLLVKDADLAGNASLGISVDHQRNRLLVAIADVLGNRYSALAAYDLDSWERLFLTHLSSPGGEKAFADDVAVDKDGNSYVTDAKGGKIWKVSAEGKLLSTITSPLFQAKEWYGGLISLNGIVYHPDGYLLVIHTMSGLLYKIDGLEEEGKEVVKVVEGVRLRLGDGIELVSGTRLVVAASHPSARLVESMDGWVSAREVGRFVGPAYRVATAATVKEGRVFLSHLLGFGYPEKKHMLVEAIFS